MEGRKTKVQSWYLDVSMLRNYYMGNAEGDAGRHAFEHENEGSAAVPDERG